MVQQIKFEATENSSKIEETFEIDTNNPTSVQLLNMFIHLELFLDKLYYPSIEAHRVYVKMLDAFGVLPRVLRDIEASEPSIEILEEFGIETHEKFLAKLRSDESFSYFIYDFLKEKL